MNIEDIRLLVEQIAINGTVMQDMIAKCSETETLRDVRQRQYNDTVRMVGEKVVLLSGLQQRIMELAAPNLPNNDVDELMEDMGLKPQT
jgi:hypothetical protein